MSEGPWIRFFPSNWLAGTRGLSASETGIYITLIAMMYERGEPLMDDRQRLARLCGTTPKAFDATLQMLMDMLKIEIVSGGLWNDKVEAETENRRQKSSQARESADKRWEKRKRNQASKDANAKQTQSDGNASYSYTNSNTSSLRSDVTRESGFDDWYSRYPNKVGKPAAKTAYSKALKKVSPEVLTEGLSRYLAKTDDRQWCNPATWLNQERWTDEPAVVARGSPHPLRGLAAVQERIKRDIENDQRTNGSGGSDQSDDVGFPFLAIEHYGRDH